MMSFASFASGIAMFEGRSTGVTPGVHTASVMLPSPVSSPPAFAIAALEQSKLPSAPARAAMVPVGSVTTAAWCTTLRLPGTTWTPVTNTPAGYG